jgi:predicted RNase H-like HicB family nuclease
MKLKELFMKNIFYYPAIFTPDENGAFMVTFPDIEGCVTYGDDELMALEMAEEALGTYLEDMEKPPAASSISKLEAPDGGFISHIKVDMGKFLEKYGEQRAVKKTLSIPDWLDKAAKRKKINFSKALQDALKEMIAQ